MEAIATEHGRVYIPKVRCVKKQTNFRPQQALKVPGG
jgi:hypothetical protein